MITFPLFSYESSRDEFVKNRNSIEFVILAKAGIQFIQDVLDPGACPGPDPGFAGVTPQETFYESIKLCAKARQKLDAKGTIPHPKRKTRSLKKPKKFLFISILGMWESQGAKAEKASFELLVSSFRLKGAPDNGVSFSKLPAHQL
jgi:hypothetical protein